MILVLSPAKTLDESSPPGEVGHSQPEFLEESRILVDHLRTLSAPEIAQLMSVSEKLANLNHQRYQEWRLPFTPANSKQAILTFKGDVYTGFDLAIWQKRDFDFAQKTIRILSGLYGLLRPLDLMQPYRLEMGTGLKNARGKDLYQFWGKQLTDSLNAELSEHQGSARVLLNLASVEYFKAIQLAGINAPTISPIFKDEKNGIYKIISFHAKKARGMMADFIVRQRIKDPADLRDFNSAGYHYDAASSTVEQPVFLRKEAAAQAAVVC